MPQKNSTERVNRFSNLLEQHEKKAVLGVVLVALVVRFIHLYEIANNDPFFTLPSVDPNVYHKWAISIIEDNFLGDSVFFLSPLYPYFLSLVYAVFGVGHTVAKVVQMLLGAVNCVLIYAIGKRIFNARVGLISSAIWALYVMSIFYDGILLVTAIQTPLNLLTILLLLGCQDKPSLPKWLLAGGVLGLSALARPNVLLLPVFVLGWLLVEFVKRSEKKRTALYGLVFCTGIAATLLPVTLRNLLVGDDFVLVSAQGGVNFYIGNGPNATGKFRVPRLFPTTRADDPKQQREAYQAYAEKMMGRPLKPSEVSDFWYGQTYEHIVEQPWEWVGLLFRKLRLFVNQYEIANSRHFYSSRDFSSVLRAPLPNFLFVGSLALVGMVIAWRERRRAFFLYSIVGTYAVSLTLFFMLAHYRMPVVPFFTIFAGLTLDWFLRQLKGKKLRALAMAAVGLAISVSVVNGDMEGLPKDDGLIHYNLANKYRNLGQPEKAIEEYENAIEVAPNYISAHNNLALTCEMDVKNHDKAIRAWRRVLSLAKRRGDRMYIDRATRHLRRLEAYHNARRSRTNANTERHQ